MDVNVESAEPITYLHKLLNGHRVNQSDSGVLVRKGTATIRCPRPTVVVQEA